MLGKLVTGEVSIGEIAFWGRCLGEIVTGAVALGI